MVGTTKLDDRALLWNSAVACGVQVAFGGRTVMHSYLKAIVAVAACLLSMTWAHSANAAVLFNNPLDQSAQQTFWCDPCSSGNVGYRVWDSFTLASDAILKKLQWIGLRADPMTLGAVVEIANSPYGTDIFDETFSNADISRTATGVNSDANTVTLPDITLAGDQTYWITVHGPSITEQFTWLGQVEANGDNSLIQYGPNPDTPQFTFPRDQDARFELFGAVTPLPAALPLFAAGLGAMSLFGWRRKQKNIATLAAA